MYLCRSIESFIKIRKGPCIATVGNFDGMHLGHQTLFAQMQQQARQLNMPCVVMMFEPQPQEFFLKENAPARLSTFREKWYALEKLQIDYVCLMRFNASFAALDPQTFIQKILIEGLQVQHLYVGSDFRFGAQRKGDIDLLRAARQFTVQDIPLYLMEGERVSSTCIRKYLTQGHMQLAEKLLGRPYAMQGRVQHGDKRGRLLGFPTANLRLNRQVPPLKGVYVVEVHGLKKPQYGVANIGKRPTLCGMKELLEVHLFDFSGDLYGQRLEVKFLHRLREEQRFGSLDELRAQIAKDCKNARTFLSEVLY